MNTVLGSLDSFPILTDLPTSEREIRAVVQSNLVRHIICYVLGPSGTNISQAAEQWVRRMGVADKTSYVYCKTPEQSLEQARLVNTNGVLALFGTCAVFYALKELFFCNPAALPFFVQEIMPLDDMQLAVRPGLACSVRDGMIPSVWHIASHPSPAPLVRTLGCRIVEATSNAAAADMCRDGEVELCITTESARHTRELVKLHSFGSPPMVFFYGIAGPSIEFVRRVFADSSTQEAIELE